MKAQELRIGNLVRLFLGVDDNGTNYREYKISGIMTDSIGSSHYLVGNMWIEISNNLEPIPLTEEWLLRFGFSDTDYKSGLIGKDFQSGDFTLDFVLTKPLVKGKWNTTYTFQLEDYRFCKLEFVHQLQNLYWCLCGEELEINVQ